MPAPDDPHHAQRVRKICLYRRSRSCRFSRVLVNSFTARGASVPRGRSVDLAPGGINHLRGFASTTLTPACPSIRVPGPINPEPLAYSPAVVSWGLSRLDVFGISSRDGGLRHRWYDGQNWSIWENLGGAAITASPAACSWGPERLDSCGVRTAPSFGNTTIPLCGGLVWVAKSS